jgi:hypothetical protein
MRLLIEYVRDLVLSAKGNVITISLRQAKRALGVESKSEEAALRVALEALATLGLLQRAPGKKPRYVLQRGSPLWEALERRCTDLLSTLMGRNMPPRRRKARHIRGCATGMS